MAVSRLDNCRGERSGHSNQSRLADASARTWRFPTRRPYWRSFSKAADEDERLNTRDLKAPMNRPIGHATTASTAAAYDKKLRLLISLSKSPYTPYIRPVRSLKLQGFQSYSET